MKKSKNIILESVKFLLFIIAVFVLWWQNQLMFSLVLLGLVFFCVSKVNFVFMVTVVIVVGAYDKVSKEHLIKTLETITNKEIGKYEDDKRVEKNNTTTDESKEKLKKLEDFSDPEEYEYYLRRVKKLERLKKEEAMKSDDEEGGAKEPDYFTYNNERVYLNDNRKLTFAERLQELRNKSK